MGRKRLSGLSLRAGVWHIDKRIGGRRVCQSTGAGDIQEAERYLARLMDETRQAQVYGVRPARTFEQAAAKFVRENQHKRSIGDDVSQLRHLVPWLGATPLDRIHLGTFQVWIDKRRKAGKATGTINHGLKVVRRILNLAASEWVDEHGLTWISAAPKLKLLPDVEKRKPYPTITWPIWRSSRSIPAAATGGLQPPLGVGGDGPRTRDERVHHSGRARQERGRAPRGAAFGLGEGAD
ncbi:MAG: hypothetical protein R3D31_03350 [Hyphomicrobiaceae bacterium]